MNITKCCMAILLCAISTISLAQQPGYNFSDPVDIRELGVNKVLCMKNGNTMLFHFEIARGVIVKVFDSTHKEIASQKHLCNILDINILYDAIFKGLFEINGEAVLFIEQEHLSKKMLVRLRFNATDGKLLEEKVAGESQSLSKPNSFYVMKNRTDDNYAIFCCADAPQFKDCTMYVAYYNGRHEELKQVPLEVGRKDYDFIHVIGAELQPNGVCITLSLDKLITNATSSGDIMNTTVATYDHVFVIAYIPAGNSAPQIKAINLSKDTYPFYSHFTYNAFAGSLNILLYNYKEFLTKNGLEYQPSSFRSSLLFNLDEHTLDMKYNWMNNDMANVYYKQQTDSTKLFEGLPVKMFTNGNGLTTMVYEGYRQYYSMETRARADLFESYLGKIGITQCDDEGKELWGIILPDAQYLKSYRHYYYAREIGKKWQTQTMFGDLPEFVYDRQFVSLNTYTFSNNYYIIYNDYNKNFNNSMAHPGDTVYSFTTTNGCYYKVGKKKEVTKNYLFGTPVPDEYNTVFIEGADFDEQRGTYAALVQSNKDKKTFLRMGWSKLN